MLQIPGAYVSPSSNKTVYATQGVESLSLNDSSHVLNLSAAHGETGFIFLFLRGRERVVIHWLTPHMPATTWIKARESETPSELPYGRTQLLESSILLPRIHINSNPDTATWHVSSWPLGQVSTLERQACALLGP